MPELRLYLSVLPAYAGMIPTDDDVIIVDPGTTRIRGDDPVIGSKEASKELYYPHTWG